MPAPLGLKSPYLQYFSAGPEQGSLFMRGSSGALYLGAQEGSMMRRAFVIAAAAAMMLAAGEPAMAQSPNQVQMQSIRPKLQPKVLPKIQLKVQNPNRPSNLPLIKPSQAIMIAKRQFPNSKAIDVKLLPGGNYAVTLRQNNTLQRVIVDGGNGDFR
jgi:hypothetical protein